MNDDQQHYLTVKDLHVHYNKICAVQNIDFEVSCGRTIAIIGGNGAGKTTLLKSIVGIVPKLHGEILWKGQPILKNTYEIAYLPQKEKIDWNFPLTVEGLVEMGRYPLLGPFKTFGKKDKKAVDGAIDLLQINDLRYRQIGALSGGQQQRTFIARALAQEAHVLLLDEPFTGLDQPSKESLIDLFSLLKKQCKLIMASHHDLKTVGDIFDQTVLMKRNLIAFGQTDDVLKPDLIKKAF